MRLNSALWIALVATLLMAGPLLAHHSFSMFEMNKDVTYTGTVVEYKWVNPHVHVTLQVDPGAGVEPSTVGTWDIEGASTNIMARQVWTKSTFKACDKMTVIAHPMKDGSKGASMFYIILPDGKRIYQDIARPKAEQ